MTHSFSARSRCDSSSRNKVMGQYHFSLPHKTCMNDLTLTLSQLLTFTVLHLSVSTESLCTVKKAEILLM